MLLPTAYCPHCRRDCLIHRSPALGAGTDTPLHVYCVDCDARLDRFGLDPVIQEKDLKAVQALGYRRLDGANPVAAAGCFATKGCEGCDKIDSRPW